MNSDSKTNRLISPGLVLGLLSAACLAIGVYAPAVDFSSFNSSIDLQYNLIKICKNIELISSMWRAIPVGFLISAGMMLILSFVRIPVFRVIPCILAIAMVLLMVLDMGNIIDWVEKVLEKYFEIGGPPVGAGQVLHSIMCGVYILIAGIIAGVVSIFVK